MNNKDIIKKEIDILIKNKTINPIIYNQGNIVFNEGDNCQYLGYLIKGKITISTLSFNDKEEIISNINEGDFFGQFLLFNDENNKYLGDVISTKKSLVALINKELLNEIMMKNKTFLNAYLSIISEEAYKIKQQVKLFSHKKNVDRIIYYLKNNTIDNKIDIKSVSALAKVLNLPRENVSRIINKLIKDGYITKENNIITCKKN